MTRKRQKRKIYKRTIIFIILDIFVAICFFVMYGPWNKVRNMYVNTAMKTMHHQYFANIFYSDKTIEKIMNSNYFVSIEEDANTDDIVINTKEKTKYKDKYEEELFTRDPGNDLYKVINLKIGTSNGYLVAIYKPEKVKLISTKQFNVGGYGERIITMCQRYNGKVCINGGGFYDNGMGSDIPTGYVIQNGKITWASEVADSARDNIIGITKDGIMLFLVVDGENYINGASLQDMVDVLERYGAYNAANLDGGQSSSLVIENKLYNNPPAAAKKQGGRYVVTGWGLIP